ncbi:MAG: nitroreductase family protein [Oscillospiraceae bacterium]|jgi:nitroreductase|nr:nitroreductase family protein [Oscillospiraceae bacterium]
MNDTLKHITGRYTCRDFKSTPLTKEQVGALADAALAAPSAMNLQPWHVIIVTDKAFVDELDTDGMSILAAAEDKSGYDRIMSRGGKLFYNAPCLVLVLSDGSDWGTLDCGILCQNVVIGAQSLGRGSCIVGMAGVPLNGPNGDDYKKRLNFPDGHSFAIGVLVGEINSGKEPHEHNKSKVSYIE